MTLLLSSLSFAVYASSDNCKISNLSDLTVFASENISAKKSDYQGSIAAGGDILLKNFYIDQTKCLSVSAQGSVSAINFSSKGSLEGLTSMSVKNANIRAELRSNGKILISTSLAYKIIGPSRPQVIYADGIPFEKRRITSTVNFDQLTKQMNDLSIDMANKKRTLDYQIKNKKIILSTEKQNNTVTQIAGELFESEIKKIEIHGDVGKRLIINITGTDIALRGIDVQLVGSISPHDIIWNFQDATKLYIKNTANGLYGIPGTLIAPQADVEFYDGLITGALYTKAINYIDATNSQSSGQINDGRISDLTIE